MKLGMVVDLAKCIGCDACSVACKVENSTPGSIWWAPVVQKEVGVFPKSKLVFLPTLCMHCEDPPCMKSCPSKAIEKRTDGIVMINEEKCCGAGACVSACPYNAITIWRKEEAYLYGERRTPLDDMALSRHKVGAAQKCTFNVERIDRAKEKGLTPGCDRDATPACVLACPVECRIFGDLEDKESPPSKYLQMAEDKGRTVFVPLPEAKTRPKVAYMT